MDFNIAGLLIPTIVVGGQGQCAETDFRFAGQFGFLQIGHADHMGSPTAVHMRLRPGGKLRPFDAQVGAAAMHRGARLPGRLHQYRGELLAKRIRQADMGGQPLAKKCARPLAGAVDELVGHDQMAGSDFGAQTAHRADRNNPLDA
jgi:hypothetical protein